MTRPAVPPSAAPAPAGRRDPFGFGVGAPARAPAPAAAKPEEDFGDIDMDAPHAGPARAAPTPAPAPVPDLSFDLDDAGPAKGPESIELPEAEEEGAPELAPMHAFVPPAAETGHAPAPAAPPARDGGEALLREALSKASLEVIEKVVWEVVPQLAETIIRENLEKLVAKRQG